MPPFDSGLPVTQGARIDDIGRIGTTEFIHHPRHLPFARAYIGSRNVDTLTDQAALVELLGKAAGDALEFLRRPLARIDLQRALGAAEGNVDERAFQRHQRGQCLDLFGIGIGCVADTALDRFAMLAVDRAPADEAVHATAQTHTEADRIGRVALNDSLCQSLRQIKE